MTPAAALLDRLLDIVVTGSASCLPPSEMTHVWDPPYGRYARA
jgi:hypothetical protein